MCLMCNEEFVKKLNIKQIISNYIEITNSSELYNSEHLSKLEETFNKVYPDLFLTDEEILDIMEMSSN